MPRRKPQSPLPDDVMEKLRQAGANATPPKVPLPHNASSKQLLSAVLVLVAAFIGAGVLTGLFLRLALFVAGR
jgi:hypothetical protein